MLLLALELADSFITLNHGQRAVNAAINVFRDESYRSVAQTKLSTSDMMAAELGNTTVTGSETA